MAKRQERLDISLGLEGRTVGKNVFNKTWISGLNGEQGRWGTEGCTNVSELWFFFFMPKTGQTSWKALRSCGLLKNRKNGELVEGTAELHLAGWWSLQRSMSALQTVFHGASSGSDGYTGNWTVADWARTSSISRLGVESDSQRESYFSPESLPCKCNVSVTIYTIKTHKWSRDEGRVGLYLSKKSIRKESSADWQLRWGPALSA